MSPRRRPAPSRPSPSRDRDALELVVLAPEPAAETAALLASFRSARVLAPFPRRGGEAGRRWQRIIRAQERILAVLDGRAAGAGLPRGRELTALGRDLFEALFPDDVRRLYDVARSLHRDGALDIVFTSMIDWVADKPWELAFDPVRRSFLAAAEANFVRNAFTAVPAELPPPRRGRLRILVASARPRTAAPVSAREELALIRRGFRELREAGLAELDVLPAATPEALHRRLVDRAVDVLHFVGHGDYDERAREGHLLLEDGRGGERPLTAAALRQMLGRRGLRLVFLNACATGRGGRAEFNRGVAPALVAAGVPAVVANQYSVLDSAATAFARDFYWALARGATLGDAAREARIALGQALGTEAIDWAVPVVYARDPREVLCRPVAAARRSAPRPRAVARRRAGLWDVERSVGDLEAVTRELNAQQRRFAFEVVEAGLPLAALKGRRGTALDARALGEHLSRLRRHLRLDRLIALTTADVAGRVEAPRVAIVRLGPKDGKRDRALRGRIETALPGVASGGGKIGL